MKKMIFAIIFCAAATASNAAFAFGFEKLTINGKVVRVSDIDSSDDGHVFKPADLSGGVYIVAVTPENVNVIAPKTTAIIREWFAGKGIKVVDNSKDAAYGMKFVATRLSCDSAQDNGTSGQLAYNVITSLGGGFQGRSSRVMDLQLDAYIMEKPSENMASIDIGKFQYSNPLKALYNIKDESAVESVLKLVTDQWIKNYVKE